MRTLAILVLQAAGIVLAGCIGLALCSYLAERSGASGTSLGLILLYFAPTAVAGLRSHNNFRSIMLTNLLLGWTAIGWIVALIWSFTDNVKAAAQ